MKTPGDRCPYKFGSTPPRQCEKKVGHDLGHTFTEGDTWTEWGSAPSTWEPLRQFTADIPQRCGVCLDVMSGDDITYLPNFCQIPSCPGAADPVRDTVRLFRPFEFVYPEAPDGDS